MGLGLGNLAGGFVEGYRKGSAIQDAKADRDAKNAKTKREKADADRADAVREVYKNFEVPDVDEVAADFDPKSAGIAAAQGVRAAREEAARKDNRKGLVGVLGNLIPAKLKATAAAAGIGAPPPPLAAAPGEAPAAAPAAAGLGVAPPTAAPAAVAAPPGAPTSDLGQVNMPEAGVTPKAEPGLGVASPAAAPAAPGDEVEVDEVNVVGRGRHKITKSEAALKRLYALRELGDTAGSMEAYKEFQTERGNELSMSLDGASDDQLAIRLAEAYHKDFDSIQIKKDADGSRHVFVDGEEAHTFPTRAGMTEYVKGVMTSNPQALMASMNMDANQLKIMAGQAGIQQAAAQMAAAAKEGRRKDRKEYRDEKDWQRAQANYDRMDQAAEVFGDPDAAFTRPDEYKAAVEYYASPQSGMAKTEATFEDKGDTSEAGQRHDFQGQRRVAYIKGNPYFQGSNATRIIAPFNQGKGFAVRNPKTGKFVAANGFDHAEAMAKAWYPNGPPNAKKK